MCRIPPFRYCSLLAFAFLLSMVNLVAAQETQPGNMTVFLNYHHDVSPPLRDMAKRAKQATNQFLQHEVEPIRRIPLPTGLAPITEDSVRQRTQLPATPLVVKSFEGIGEGQYGFSVQFVPPDTNGAVGLTQYVQWVNAAFAVFNKSTGALITGPTPGNTLWTGFGGACETSNDGDPIAIYDKMANRWVMSQFTSSPPYMQCIAVSTTSDATGTYYRYSFPYSALNDYPKMGVWPDGYYETFNMFQNGSFFLGAQACAYDRTSMLAGRAATQICFGPYSSFGGLLPADLDGSTLPPNGSPNYMLYFGASNLNLYKFHADFQNSNNSTFTGPTVISVAAFSPLCGGGTCVVQPSPGHLLDSLADRLMYRLAYRNFGSHESLVVNHSVTVSGSGGVRWYEIQNPSGTPAVAQQGTFAPDTDYRWMASVAMDKVGDLAVGYSRSSSATHPSILFAGRTPSDPAGMLEAETNVVSGGGSQTSYSRWGDYSAMTLDPVDDCTFWYTQEYETANGVFNWNTRILNFRFPGCTATGVAQFDPSFGAPSCNQVSRSCDSGAYLLLGRANIIGGAEPNQPNTIHSSCADGTAGTFHVDESIDRLQVAAVGGALRPGQVARIYATVWVKDKTQDALDVYYTTNAASPAWKYVATVRPTGNGAQTLSTIFHLGVGTQQAVRAVFRRGGSVSSCSSGSFDDHDDLVFTVGPQ